MEQKKIIQKNRFLLEKWESEGVPCYYARFQGPVPPSLNKEPVSEFYLKSSTNKYVVDRITYTEHGLIWRANSELNMTPLANVQYVRSINDSSR